LQVRPIIQYLQSLFLLLENRRLLTLRDFKGSKGKFKEMFLLRKVPTIGMLISVQSQLKIPLIMMEMILYLMVVCGRMISETYVW